MAGFETMAVESVKRVRAVQSTALKSAAPGSRASHIFPLVSALGIFCCSCYTSSGERGDKSREGLL